jgi:photolyase PhrII
MPSLPDLVESLPELLRERTRSSQRLSTTTAIAGAYVLYWMHSAMRVDENPALLVATHIANQLKLPLVVYQGLSERYPYASDRHHTFILEGAREVQREFVQRRMTYLLNVETTEGSSEPAAPHLLHLARRAAVVVTEDMPVSPLRPWTWALKRAVAAPVVLVDTACVLPMQLVGRAFDRAYEFRSATHEQRARRLHARLPVIELECRRTPSIEPTFAAVDLQSTSIAALVARCRIDHTLGPIANTPGGATAGYARWNAFKQRGLAAYARTRNDATRDGTSRMSPYLHYGMVSPLRIAREAAEMDCPGAEKYLDELLIWRELAYAFCFYRPDHARLTAIPRWAVETLVAHEADARPAHYSWETLARGCTDDALWNAAQHSLLTHGELHNNLRMTWGKALLNWTRDARQALALLIDLNHRFALDGRDPASYGGLLWCLGQFDRPFQPASPVLGTVRPRATSEHLQRLDLTRYRKRVERSPYLHSARVAVIGAGIAGLICARTLADHRLDVTLFDKSLRVGGRLSSRPSAACRASMFDHGAQYFTARDERFLRLVRSWEEQGVVREWQGNIARLSDAMPEACCRLTRRFVGTPDMNAVARHLATALSCRLATRVTHLFRTPTASGGWELRDDNGLSLGEYDYVVLALPAPQAAELLQGQASFASQLADVRWRPSWAVMLTLETPTQLPFDGAFVNDAQLSWIARNSSKPGRATSPETWLLHSTGQWAEQHMPSPDSNREERRPLQERVQQEMLAQWQRVTGCDPGSLSIAAVDSHFWRYALPENPYTGQMLFDDQQQLACCGDWCGGPRVEGAYLSGAAVAGRLLGHLAETCR